MSALDIDFNLLSDDLMEYIHEWDQQFGQQALFENSTSVEGLPDDLYVDPMDGVEHFYQHFDRVQLSEGINFSQPELYCLSPNLISGDSSQQLESHLNGIKSGYQNRSKVQPENRRRKQIPSSMLVTFDSGFKRKPLTRQQKLKKKQLTKIGSCLRCRVYHLACSEGEVCINCQQNVGTSVLFKPMCIRIRSLDAFKLAKYEEISKLVFQMASPADLEIVMAELEVFAQTWAFWRKTKETSLQPDDRVTVSDRYETTPSLMRCIPIHLYSITKIFHNLFKKIWKFIHDYRFWSKITVKLAYTMLVNFLEIKIFELETSAEYSLRMST